MEHLNRIAKDLVKGLGSNKTKAAIGKVGKLIGVIDKFLRTFDKENGVSEDSGRHVRKNTHKDIKIIISELTKHQVFTEIPGRKHSAFPRPHQLLHARNKTELLSWMVTKIL